jgi:ATP-dependent Clp protease adaptor protein ClpS
MEQVIVTPDTLEEPDVTEDVNPQDVTEQERPWLVIVHNDPVNLMSYVTWVLMKLFGYQRAKAHKLMLEVHNNGRAVVSSGPREKAELDCFRLHAYGLWATMTKSE